MSLPQSNYHSTNLLTGPDNKYITYGPHYEDFKKSVEKTQFVGRALPAGNVWKAKGANLQSPHIIIRSPLSPDILIAMIANNFRKVTGPYEGNLPDLGYVLTLPNDVYTGSNFYAVQKTFDGPFQFDVFFESGSAEQKLSCESVFFLLQIRRKRI